jgi:hypothetical protein
MISRQPFPIVPDLAALKRACNEVDDTCGIHLWQISRRIAVFSGAHVAISQRAIGRGIGRSGAYVNRALKTAVLAEPHTPEERQAVCDLFHGLNAETHESRATGEYALKSAMASGRRAIRLGITAKQIRTAYRDLVAQARYARLADAADSAGVTKIVTAAQPPKSDGSEPAADSSGVTHVVTPSPATGSATVSQVVTPSAPAGSPSVTHVVTPSQAAGLATVTDVVTPRLKARKRSAIAETKQNSSGPQRIAKNGISLTGDSTV